MCPASRSARVVRATTELDTSVALVRSQTRTSEGGSGSGNGWGSSVGISRLTWAVGTHARVKIGLDVYKLEVLDSR